MKILFIINKLKSGKKQSLWNWKCKQNTQNLQIFFIILFLFFHIRSAILSPPLMAYIIHLRLSITKFSSHHWMIIQSSGTKVLRNWSHKMRVVEKWKKRRIIKMRKIGKIAKNFHIQHRFVNVLEKPQTYTKLFNKSNRVPMFQISLILFYIHPHWKNEYIFRYTYSWQIWWWLAALWLIFIES